MGKFEGVLLASDFDNTLIYTEPAMRSGAPVPPLSEENRAALVYFMEEGGRFAVATGRALPAFRLFADQVPANAPAIVCNGAMLYDLEEDVCLEAALLGEEVLPRAQQVLDRFPGVAVEAYHVDNVIYAVHPNEVTRRHIHLTKVGVEERPSVLEVPLPLGKLLFEGERAELEEVLAFLEEQGWAQAYELIFSAKNLLELTVKGANKGGMVRRLAQRLGISMEHVYCAGDEGNDISMLTTAAEGFAPANCAEAVRACGATIVAHAQEHAMAQIIEILDRKYS